MLVGQPDGHGNNVRIDSQNNAFKAIDFGLAFLPFDTISSSLNDEGIRCAEKNEIKKSINSEIVKANAQDNMAKWFRSISLNQYLLNSPFPLFRWFARMSNIFVEYEVNDIIRLLQNMTQKEVYSLLQYNMNMEEKLNEIVSEVNKRITSMTIDACYKQAIAMQKFAVLPPMADEMLTDAKRLFDKSNWKTFKSIMKENSFQEMEIKACRNRFETLGELLKDCTPMAYNKYKSERLSSTQMIWEADMFTARDFLLDNLIALCKTFSQDQRKWPQQLTIA
jgi:hypothetical protein